MKHRLALLLAMLLMLLMLLMLMLASFAVAEDSASISPTTGLPYLAGRGDAYRPVIVETSNSKEARTQLNMSLADVVYEYVVWAPEHTRFLAVYNDVHPEIAGSIRGSRFHAFALRDGWDCPIIHYGGQDSAGTSIYDYMETHGTPKDMSIDGTRFTHPEKVFFRLEGADNPHNAMANVALAVDALWPTADDGTPYEPQLPALVFADGDIRGEEAARVVHMPFTADDYLVSFHYDDSTGCYVRHGENGKPWLDRVTGDPLAAENLLVQYVDQGFFNNSPSRPVIETVGEGPLDAFIDGWHFEGTWKREDASEPIAYYGPDGKPLALKPGKTFIELIPNTMDAATFGDS